VSKPVAAVAAPPPRVDPSRSEASVTYAVAVAQAARESKCQNVVILDVRGLSPITDVLVLATATSGRQMRAVAKEVVEIGREKDYSALSTSGLDGETWVCVDFVDVLFHIFNPESRQYYDLESLWGDAKPVELPPPGTLK